MGVDGNRVALVTDEWRLIVSGPGDAIVQNVGDGDGGGECEVVPRTSKPEASESGIGHQLVYGSPAFSYAVSDMEEGDMIYGRAIGGPVTVAWSKK
ncbi:hypothetical protein [Oricola sp.]|uniref:hypothetical protein n=1 Tax=Oricola sp. TaxID=1979950 RepID=UPI0025DE4115|nr:hypothetical protein [Oricola sp.]MCI5075541.1 hypothetical protein [Oricola sp.]